MKKILVIYATAGIGHKKAAIAVTKALDEIAPKDTSIGLIDALDYTTDFFKWTYLKLYLTAVNKFSALWGFMYYLTDNPIVNAIVAVLRRLNNAVYSERLIAYLREAKPDVVISTHFFASEVIAELKKSGRIATRLITVVTDYRLHLWWLADGTDTYIAVSDDAKRDMIKRGVDPARVAMTGMPVEPIFSKPLDRKAILDTLGFTDDIFTVLVIGGGFGVGPIEAVVKAAGAVSRPVQLVVICGHNKELVAKIEALKTVISRPMKVVGFVDNVYEYMAAADILISKSGGMTVAESMAKELPMIVISPIPGQETRNCDFLTFHGAALRLENVADLTDALEGLVVHPERIAAMRQAVHAIKRPTAAYDVARLALEP